MLSQHEIEEEEHIAWFEKVVHDKSRHLLIAEESGTPLGYIQFNGVASGGTSDWGFYARPDAPRGSGTKLCEIGLRHAFDVLALHKVSGQVLSNNRASISLHRKLGFTEEGILREHQRINDTYYSIICFGLLAGEWRALRDNSGRQE